jgi:hypothetical protein
MVEKPVLELAKKLKARIKDYGGAKAVWEQLDPRFKASEEVVFEGVKRAKTQTITWDAFDKSVERLDIEHPTFEKMSFGIKGNPLLLMNVFKILGIKGFMDIADETFVPPNPSVKIFALDSKLDGLSRQIHELSDIVEIYVKKRPRITVLKVTTDIEEILQRLISILDNNSDPRVDLLLLKGQNALFNNTHSANKPIENNIELLRSFNNQMSYIQQANTEKFFNHIKNQYFNFYSGEDKKVLYFFNILIQFHEYCYYHKVLRNFYRILMDKRNLKNDFKEYRENNIYTLSPLYFSVFCLIVILQYINKMRLIKKGSDKIEDEIILNRVKKRMESQSENKSITYFGYLEKVTRDFIKYILRLINCFDITKTSPQPNMYQKYEDILKRIAKIYYDSIVININEFTDAQIDEYVKSIKNVFDLFTQNNFFVLKRIKLNEKIIDDIDILINDLSNLVRNTKRDING